MNPKYFSVVLKESYGEIKINKLFNHNSIEHLQETYF